MNRLPEMPDEIKRKVCDLARQGLPYREIAEIVGYREETVCKWALRGGIRRQTKGSRPVAKIREMYESGKTTAEIAKAIGCSPNTVANTMRLYGIPVRKVGPRPKCDPMQIDFARTVRKMTWAELGRLLKMDQSSVRRFYERWLLRRLKSRAKDAGNLKRRPKS